MPLQDVKTRWNSTFLMMRRAKRLRPTFTSFCIEYDRADLELDDDEWRQVDYLLWITQPFFDFTLELSKTKDTTTHHVFKIYNKLFQHLEVSSSRLRRKKVPWKRKMLQALEAAHCKLSGYYSQTENIQGDLYATSTMLAPSNKLKFFLTKDWDQKWRDQYQKSFKDFLAPYQECLSKELSSPLPNNTPLRSGSRLDMMLNGFDYQARPLDEFREYLDSGMYLNILSAYGYANTFVRYCPCPTTFILEG